MRKPYLPTQLLATTLVASLILLSPGIEGYRAWAGPNEIAVEGAANGSSPALAILPTVQASIQGMSPSAYGHSAAGIDVSAMLSNIRAAANTPQGLRAAQLISQRLASDPESLRSFSEASPAQRAILVSQATTELSSHDAAFAAANAPAAHDTRPAEQEAISNTVASEVKDWQRGLPASVPTTAVQAPSNGISSAERKAAAQKPALTDDVTPPAPAQSKTPAEATRSIWASLARPLTSLNLLAISASSLYGASAHAMPDGMPVSYTPPSTGVMVAVAASFLVVVAAGLYAMIHAIKKQDARELAQFEKDYPNAKAEAEARSAAETAALTPPPSAPEPPKPPRDIEKQAMLEDVAGQSQAKEEIESLVDYLKNPQPYQAVGAQGYKGVLLIGPPGTGKTMLARAIANEAGIPVVTRKGSEFVRMFVGKGADNVEAAFKEARAKAVENNSAAILYIDEIDAVGGERSDNGTGGDREQGQTLNQLLSEMDGFEKDVEHPIILMASTNRADMLDAALLRGGRFELQIPVGLPDVEGREAVLKVHTRNKPLSKDVDLKTIAKHTPGLSGADLKAVVNDAAMLAGRRRSPQITMEDLVAAVDRKTVGHKRKLVMSEGEKRIVAYHEAGHALVSHLLPDADPVRKVTIVPHGLNMLGYMQAMPEEDRNIQSYRWLVDRMAVALGGRVAEEMMTGQKYSGAQNDLEAATRIARHMVMKFGMSDKIGHVAYDIEGTRPASGRPLSEETNRVIDAEVKQLLDDATTRAKEVLSANKGVLEAMAQELREKETLRSEDMDRLIPHPAAPGGGIAQR